MSDFGTLMDAVVTASAAAVTGLVAERNNRLAKSLENASDFPHLFVYGPSQVVERAAFHQSIGDTRIRCRLVTRGETQEAFLLKLDLIAAAIVSDATLLAASVDVFVESTDTAEDPTSTDKFAELVVVVVQES